MQIHYQDESGKASTRKINPLGMMFWGANWTVVAWCQLRDDYRLFRLDRIERAQAIEESFSTSEACSFEHYVGQFEKDISTGFW